MSTKSSIIDQRSHPLVRRLIQVREGKEPGLFIEGDTLLSEAFVAKLKIQRVFTLKSEEKTVRALLAKHRALQLPLHVLSDSVMTFAADTEASQGVIALSDPMISEPLPEPTLASWKPSLIVVASGIQHPQNLGNILRTAEAAGVDEVWTIKGSVDPFSPKVIRGSAGSIFRVAVRTRLDWNAVHQCLNGHAIHRVAAHQGGTVTYDAYNWKQSTALFLGAEGPGFTSQQMKDFSRTLKIPMEGNVESLNVGTAAAVCLFEAVRQKRAFKGADKT